MCETLSNAGLFTGLWDGIIACISLVADIFLDINVYDECNDTWFYPLGFVIGLFTFGWSIKLFAGLWWIVLPVSFIIWLFSLVFSSIITLTISVLIIIGVLAYNRYA